MDMKVCLVFLTIFASMLPVKTKNALPLPVLKYPSQKAIQALINKPLLYDDNRMDMVHHQNSFVRKTNPANIPIYILTKLIPKPNRNEVLQAAKLFNQNGMIYLNEPRNTNLGQFNEDMNDFLTLKTENLRMENDAEMKTNKLVIPKSAFSFSDLVI